MANSEVVESFEASHDLNEVMPNLFFSEFGSVFLCLLDHLQEVAIVSALHNDAEISGGVFKETIFVTNNIWMLN